MKKIIVISFLVFWASVSFWGTAKNNKRYVYSVVNANVEALASLPMLSLECDNYSLVIICHKYCSKCGTDWVANGGTGNAGDFYGTCTCGKEYN